MYDTALATAQQLDAQDHLAPLRQTFHLPQHAQQEAIYLSGNSLGLAPKRAAQYVQAELDIWAQLASAGHTHAPQPWVSYHETVTQGLAHVVGALPHEVVAMNSLTVNLHLLMVSFYRPTSQRYKILMEHGAFPSDYYAVTSQLRFHGIDPADGLIELLPRPGEYSLRDDDILAYLNEYGAEIALVLLGGVNYLSGQVFDMAAITHQAHAQGVVVGFDLAHAAGNVLLHLHDWHVDFAVWCCYKYLNAGPGSIAAAFVHEKHVANDSLPRFSGWWGHNKKTRFSMPKHFDPILSAEAWQLSNPSILALATLRAGLEDFIQVGMPALRAKSERLTGYLAYLLQQKLADAVSVITPSQTTQRGSQLSLLTRQSAHDLQARLQSHGVICDCREPNIIRVAPTALYNRFTDVYYFVQILQSLIRE